MYFPPRLFVVAVAWAAACSIAPQVVRANDATSLTLDDAISFALSHNPDVLRARAALQAARAESLAAAVPTYNPELDADVARGGDSVVRGTDWSASVGVAQTLERSGKRSARLAVAAAMYGVADAQVREQERRVALALRRAFTRAGILADRRAALALNATLDRELADATGRRARDGVVTPFTSRLTALDASRSEGDLLQNATEERAAVSEVRVLLGAPSLGDVRLVPLADSAEASIPADSTLVAFSLSHRADLEPLRQQIALASAQRVLAEREGRSDPTVGISLETSQQTLTTVHGDPAITRGISSISDRDYELRARVSVPLTLRNRNQAGVARAEAALLVARAELEQHEATIRADVQAAALRATDGARLASFYREAAAHAQEDLALVHDAYRGGRISVEEYLTDKGRLLDAIMRSLEAAERALTARTELESAIGAPLDDMQSGGSSR